METVVLVDGNGKMMCAIHKKGGFRGRGSGYLLYLYDVIEMVTKKENQI
jgi:hypothetical protein